MVFAKQHLSLFLTLALALAFLAVYANAVPTTALSSLNNEGNVERLRGDLHQFIELIISCLTSSRNNHSKLDSSQIQQFKHITASLQEDVGISPENGENPETRKFDSGNSGTSKTELVENSSEAPNESPEGSDEDVNSKEGENENTNTSNASDDDVEGDGEALENRREFEIHGDSHGFTPRPAHIDVTEFSTVGTTLANPTSQPEDIGLRRLNGESKEDTSQETKLPEGLAIASGATSDSASGAASGENDEVTTSKPLVEIPEDLKKTIERQKQMLEELRERFERISNLDISKLEGIKASLNLGKVTSTSTSNESKEKSDNADDIQVRNLIKDTSTVQYATDSSVHPYDALHIYGIQTNGPINKIVFEGGEHHPPRPLTIKESKHLKEFIKMVLATNKIHHPMATFPTGEEISARAGFKDNFTFIKSPWADKPVPLELV